MKLAAGSIVLADATVLGVLRPDPTALAALVSAPRSWLAREGADAVCVRLTGAALWVIAVWVAIGLLAAAAAQLPGTVGHRARRVSQMVLPRVLQRVLVGSAGLGVLLAPAVAQARSHWAPAPIASPPPVTAGVNPVPGPAWPTNDADPTSTHTTTPRLATPRTATPRSTAAQLPIPGPSWPGTLASPNTPAPVTSPTMATTTPSGRDVERPSGVPSRAKPRTLSGDMSQSPPQNPARAPSPAGHVRVHDGDALWLVAAHRLGPEPSEQAIAHYWPRIFAANRAVVGDDPNLIQPGQELRLPAPTSQETS
ncbi:MAG: hypothetical protein ABI345_04095 [Jatrophihabitans sp.]